jgi:hypothetical protein
MWIPHCLDSRLTEGGEVVSLKHRPRTTPQKYFSVSGTHLCSSMSKPQGLVRPEGLRKLIKIIHLIGSQTRNLPAYSKVPLTLTCNVQYTRNLCWSWLVPVDHALTHATTVVRYTASKRKPLIFPLLGFFFPDVTNICILSPSARTAQRTSLNAVLLLSRVSLAAAK